MNRTNLKHFAIIFDEKKPRNVSYFKRLINAVSEKLGSKKKTVEDLFLRVIEENECDYRDALSVNIQDSILDYIPRIERSIRLSANTKKYFLMRDFEDLVELLTSCCDDSDSCRCKKSKSRNYEFEITVEVPRRKALKKVTVYDKVTIMERWVKIGYKLYRRHFDAWTGDEYIVVNGQTYDIKSDRYGREYLD
jgi:hypothetical protein